MWLEFLSNTGTKVINRPFVDLHRFETADTLEFYTDSSAAAELGYGCVFSKRWFFGQWEPGFINNFAPSIAYLELTALCMAVLTWSEYLCNTRIIIFCDNQAVVQMVNNCTSKCWNCMVLIRHLMLDGLVHNRRVFVRYIASKQNKLADSLSRLKLNLFKKIAPHMNEHPDHVTEKLWPLPKVWINFNN